MQKQMNFLGWARSSVFTRLRSALLIKTFAPHSTALHRRLSGCKVTKGCAWPRHNAFLGGWHGAHGMWTTERCFSFKLSIYFARNNRYKVFGRLILQSMHRLVIWRLKNEATALFLRRCSRNCAHINVMVPSPMCHLFSCVLTIAVDQRIHEPPLKHTSGYKLRIYLQSW